MNFGAYGTSGPDTLHADAVDWAARVAANSGTLTANSLGIASRFLKQCDTRSWNRKLLWIAPMLGANLAAARTPLRDWLGGGLMGNSNFVGGDFSESTGLQGNGTTKLLNTGIYPDQVARGVGLVNGGLGYWETNVNSTGATTIVMGCFDTSEAQRYALDLRVSGVQEGFMWGFNAPFSGIAAVNAHYYGQRKSSALRELYRNGVFVLNDTNADTVTGAGTRQIRLVGAFHSGAERPNAGRCGLAYMTSGDLTAAEVMDLHLTLKTYLKEASGK